eukprot:NODE_8146_length_531_cov_2.255187_g7093_i0.p5 GENE.NODE_8146_length_531_cov_2.255187_g7093_i0~~NODE_8146_length_531_cov_2.255187_g7093_i0.p5  ORF type:complete len:54 (+),score=14.34 NODE_8146_length_531_cov_2.255187_g7093_i0:168-329(+)
MEEDEFETEGTAAKLQKWNAAVVELEQWKTPQRPRYGAHWNSTPPDWAEVIGL